MRIFVGVALFASFTASAAAQGQGIRPFEADTPNWQNLAGDYYGAPDCTRDRRRADADRAIAICTQVIEGNAPRPAIAATLIVRGERHEDRQDLQAARTDFERAAALYSEEIAESPQSAAPYAGRSAAYYYLNRFDDSLADIERAIQRDSGFAAAYYRRGHLYFRGGDFAAAIADYDRTARLGERMADRGSMFHGSSSAAVTLHPLVTAARCEARAAAGVELDRAEALCRAAMRSSREHYAFSRGFLRFKQGDFEAAWTDFNTAAMANETNGYPLFARGVAAIRLGRQAEGEADIARARELEGDDLNFYANAGLAP
jgi:tetratricopeptide (TPR) repeat protein